MGLFSILGEPEGRAVLLSIRPQYADLILSGKKRVEFRRAWCNDEVGVVVLYASAPVMKLVGIAHVEKVVVADLQELWAIGMQRGAGLVREELAEYLSDRPQAYGIVLSDHRVAENPVDPKAVFRHFVPPQSFRFLLPAEYAKAMNAMWPVELSI